MRLVFLTEAPVPHMVKLCEALNKLIDTQFIFFGTLHKGRQSFYKLKVPENAIMLDQVRQLGTKKYCKNLSSKLSEFNPDVIITSGFTQWISLQAYLWALKHGKQCYVFAEIPQFKKGKKKLFQFIHGFFYSIIFRVFNKITGILAVSNHAYEFYGKKMGLSRVFQTTYPIDFETFAIHDIKRDLDSFNILFAHRLIDEYNPILAIKVFDQLSHKYPHIRMFMNANGPLYEQCKHYIQKRKLEDKVIFIEGVETWKELAQYYERCSVSLTTAWYSNGNLSILECMASGMGIVLTDRVLFNAPIIQKSKSGFVVPCEFSDIERALEQYIKEPNLAVRHGRTNRQIAKSYRADAIAQNILTHIGAV